MSSKPTPSTDKASTTAFRSKRPASKAGAQRHITSDTISADITAFKQRGGRIEILGNTPLRR